MNETLIRQRFNAAAANGQNFAAVRLPGTNGIHFIYSKNEPQLLPVNLLVGDAPVFVCSPYSAGNLGYQVTADSYYIDNNLIYGEEVALTSTETRFELPVTVQNVGANKLFYEEYVKQGVTAIRKNKLDKLVAARCESVELKDGFELSGFFDELCEQYPQAFVYCFYIQNQGCWCGATPEKLLTENKGVVETVALAGTIPHDWGEERWTDKERDEQNMTEFFIDETFKTLKLSGVRKSAVETIEAGTVKHLRSVFSWKPKPEVLIQKFGKLLAAINPTPAVCGLPQFEASLFISQNEQLERRFYSGFVGLLLPQATHLYVNLRCMELAQTNAILYAGAGITEDSNPTAEWEETSAKMETLKRLL